MTPKETEIYIAARKPIITQKGHTFIQLKC